MDVAPHVVGSILLATSYAAVGAEWQTVPETSAVAMYATTQGTTFRGVFAAYSAEIDFDVENPEAGRIVGVVKTASVDTEDSQTNTYIRGYLQVDEYPEARFESTTIQATDEGYRASGELRLAGHQKPVTMDFTFVPGSDAAVPASSAMFTASMTINRFDFDIASDVNIDQAGQDVIVYIELNLER